MAKATEINETYVTPELLSELEDILEAQGLFDDFTKDLNETAPVVDRGAALFNFGEATGLVREEYLKERRQNPNTALPDSVEP